MLPSTTSPIAYKMGRCAQLLAPVGLAHCWASLFAGRFESALLETSQPPLARGAKGALSNKALELTVRRQSAHGAFQRPAAGELSGLSSSPRRRPADEPGSVHVAAGSSMPIR